MASYKNLLTQQDVIVKNKTVTLSNEPIIFDINK